MNNQFSSASLFAVILFILSFLSTACFSQNNQIIHISTTGLKAIYLVPDERATNIEIHFVIQAGEADHDYEEGLAHYVEHMVWLNIQGTGLNNHEQHSNAWTTHLATGYWLAGPMEDLSSITSTIARAFEPVRLDSNFLAEEREIIVNEYYLHSGNDPEHSIIENLTRRLYQQSRLSRSVLGTPDDILKYQISQALSLHRATHRPGNTIALVYGNVSVEEVNDVFTLEFGLQTAPLTESVLPSHTGLSQQRIVETFESSDIIQPKLFYGKIIQLPVQFQLLEYSNRIAQLQLLSKILDSGLTGGLAKPLRFDAFIARSFGLSLRLLGDQYLEMRFNSHPDRGVTLEHLLRSFEAALDRSASYGIPDATFIRIKSRALADLGVSTNRARRSYQQALAAISVRQLPFSIDTSSQAIANIEVSDLNALLKSINGRGRTVAHLIHPLDAKEN